MSSYEAYMVKRLKEEDEKAGITIQHSNLRLTKEVEELKARIKQLETDMAYQTKLFATSPEEQRIYDLKT